MSEKISRLENGLEKLRITGSQVEELKAQLALQEVELAKKNAEADHLIQVVGVETEKVTQEKAIADEEKIKVDQINIDVTAKQIDCEKDLKKAEPALFAAQEALNTLNKANLTELKSFGSPPSAVLMVLGAVMVLIIGQQGKIPKDILQDNDWDMRAFPALDPEGKNSLNCKRNVKISAQDFFTL